MNIDLKYKNVSITLRCFPNFSKTFYHHHSLINLHFIKTIFTPFTNQPPPLVLLSSHFSYNKKVEIAMIQISRLFIMMSNEKKIRWYFRDTFSTSFFVCVVREKRKLLPLFMTMFFLSLLNFYGFSFDFIMGKRSSWTEGKIRQPCQKKNVFHHANDVTLSCARNTRHINPIQLAPCVENQGVFSASFWIIN